MKKKIFIPIIALALVCCCVIGGTIAWLTDVTDPVKNTFTVGNISIELKETPVETYKMVPGCTIAKDPTATVKAGSEDCYLFVKVEKSANFDTFMTFETAGGWTVLSEDLNVYYREVKNNAADQSFPVLKDNKVAVKDTVTKEMMDEITAAPTLTFTAYAVQLYKGNDQSGNVKFTPADAWSKIQPQP